MRAVSIRVSACVIFSGEVLIEHNAVAGAKNTFSREGRVTGIHT